MKQVYRALAGLIALGVVVQAASVATAWFMTINEIDDGLVIDEDWDGNAAHMLHGIVGMTVIPALALILFIVAFFAKVPGGVKWAGFVLLAVVVQVALAIFAFSLPAVGALHGINAFVVGGLAGAAAARAKAPAASRESEPISA